MSTQGLSPYDPALVGPYRLRGRLGSGGIGVVYLGDAPDGSPVALKCLAPGVGDEVRQRLRREAELLSAVTHPRVVRYIAADVHGVRPWLAMQYVAGPCLAEAAVPLGPAQLRHLTEGLADALQALPRQGVCHRDVKPGNIILTHDGPVLVDLGIASGSHLTSLTAIGMVVGTPAWMAPEQITGLHTGTYTDVWGWACVAVYAATGRPPFGDGPVLLLAERIRNAPPDLGGVPDWLRGAVGAGLTKDVRVRPSAEQLASVDGIRRVGASAGRYGPPAGSASLTAVLPGVGRRPVDRLPPSAAVPHNFDRPSLSRPPPQQRRPQVAAPPQQQQPPQRMHGRSPQPRPAHPAGFAPHPFVATPGPAAPRVSRSNPARPLPHPAAARPKKEKPPRPGTGRVLPHRSMGRRLLRTLLLLLLTVVVAVLAGVGAYVYVMHHLHGGAWSDAVRKVRDLLPHP